MRPNFMDEKQPVTTARERTTLACFYCTLPLDRLRRTDSSSVWTWLSCPTCGFEEAPYQEATRNTSEVIEP